MTDTPAPHKSMQTTSGDADNGQTASYPAPDVADLGLVDVRTFEFMPVVETHG